MSNMPVVPFSFESHEVRVVTLDDEPWFVAADVCEVLVHSNPTVAIQTLDDDERAKKSLGRQGEIWMISESGLYTLIFRSNKPQAKPFRRWVTHEVLPSIRKNGFYSFEEDPPTDEGSTPVTVQRLEEAAKGVKAAMIMARAYGCRTEYALQYANNLVKAITGIDTLTILNIPVPE